jgi:hypothetical protein
MIHLLLYILEGYFILGLIFGLYFVFIGAGQVDPLMRETKRGVRLTVCWGNVHLAFISTIDL